MRGREGVSVQSVMVELFMMFKEQIPYSGLKVSRISRAKKRVFANTR